MEANRDKKTALYKGVWRTLDVEGPLATSHFISKVNWHQVHLF